MCAFALTKQLDDTDAKGGNITHLQGIYAHIRIYSPLYVNGAVYSLSQVFN